MKTGRIFAGSLMTGFMLIVAGCQSSDNPTRDIADQAQPPVIKESELRAYCPNVSLRDGTAYSSRYERGGDQDPQKLTYQSTLTDATRACTYDSGNVTIKVAAAGRVVVGPAGKAGTVDMPIRVVVVRGEDVLYSKLHAFQVNVSDPSAATQFVFTDPAITIPQPDQRNVRIFVGYDEGPQKSASR